MTRQVPGAVQWRDEAVTASGQRFDETRIVGRVAEGLPDLADGGIQSVVEFDESVARPEAFVEFLARYDFARALDKRPQHLKRLFLQPDASPVLAQLARCRVKLEGAKSN